jgi:exodeoxyribonuclease VII large subunit
MSWDLFTSSAESVREPRGDDREPRRMGATDPRLSSLRAAAARPGDEWTVSEVNAAARELIEGVFPPLWIAGELTNFTRARSGHCYFTLRDAGAQLRCVMWRDDANRLPAPPQEGMSVKALGRLTIYPAKGDFQVSVTKLEAEGEGLWKLALEQLRQKLEAEGLTSPHRKRPLPRYPRVVGVVTSPTGAVFHDICNVVTRRAPWTRVVLAGCRVQGDGAALEIAAAIRRFTRNGIGDVLIVGRGGGSVEDLWAFNEERVARAIVESPVPVISAVGHETDVTIADLVADFRAPTPSAAAEAAVPDRLDIARNLQRDDWRLKQGIAGRLGRAWEDARYGRSQLERSGKSMLASKREALRGAARHLEVLSPLAAFARGFAVPLEEGRILRRRADFVAGREFDLRVSDGVVPCRVGDEDALPDRDVLSRDPPT